MAGLTKKGVYNGLTVRLQGTGKNGQPYTIYNFALKFESGKIFNLGVQSWNPDMLRLVQSIPVGANVTVTTDEKNNVLGVEVAAQPQAPAPPVPTPQVFPPAQQPVFNQGPPAQPAVFEPTPKPPVRIPAVGLTKEEIKVMSVEASIKFYAAVIGKADYFSKWILKSETDESMTTKVMDFAKVIAKYISGCGGECGAHKENKPIADPVSPRFDMPDLPPVTPDNDDIPF
jgi:hypothetical protein